MTNWLARAFLICGLSAATASADDRRIERIETTPAQLMLSGDRAASQVLVTGFAANGDVVDLTRAATFSESDVISIEAGYARSKQDGSDSIDVRVGGLSTQLQVTVTRFAEPQPVSFRWETLAILTKQGCNSGACHGKPNGRGALELSLNAFDPKLDERNLVRGSFVRFTEPLVPEQSLLLRKPTLRIPHGGGKRLRKDDEAYSILRQWIYEGCVIDSSDAPTCVKVEVEPASRVIRLANESGKQQVRVLAHFSDGTARDVTRIATYTLSNDAVAGVDAHGLVSGRERGQTAVVVRYLDDIVSAYFTFVADVPGFEWNNPPTHNYVDRFVHDKLHQLQYLPSGRCDDGTFLRRLSLDVRGLLPTAEEAKAFLADDTSDKRQKLIDQFLDAPEYARSWGLKMADLLRINREVLSPDQATAYSQWVSKSVETNMPYDRFAAELLTASGSTSQVPPANFFRVTSDTKMVTETVAQVFMGSRIMCAQCHNHPYESWTQDNYYQMASAFHEVDRNLSDESKKKELPAPGSEVTISRTPGRAMSNPRTGIEQKPWPTHVIRSVDEDKRVAFVQWLTSADNTYFARVAVNRIWSHLIGRGLVEPVDDFRSSNPPVNVELLDALANDFAASGFDRKHILRVILNSQTYQRSSDTNKFNETDEELFSHARVRLLSAEQMQDAITRLCDGGDQFAKFEQELAAAEVELNRGDLDDATREEKEKTRAAARQRFESYYMTQQPYPHLTTFLKAFGQPERKTACECERREEASLDQALQLMNSGLIRDNVNRARERLQTLPDHQLVEQLYSSAFSRAPRPQERMAVLSHLESAEDRGQAIENVVWALINTNEFMFQH
ncbi:MAG: DUF1549 and DUF1553 domain-containing protein [Planctomycetota bacterium]|nr:DUF1549 and DUF1553 domain-containing protein [Planctomycetota bacterium]